MTAALLGLILALPLQAQGVLQLRITNEDRAVFWDKIKGFEEKTPINEGGTALFRLATPKALDSLCRALLAHFQAKSFLSASIDSLQTYGDTLATAQFWLGPSMQWIQLRLADPQNEAWAKAAGYRRALFSGKNFHYDQVVQLKQRMLEQAENNGYPFASVWLDSISVQADGGVGAVLQVERKRYFAFRGLKMVGDVQLPKYFLPNYLGLRAGAPYSRERVLRLRDQLQTLLFLETTSNPSVSFSGNDATVNLFLQKKRASRFDFIVGILPQPNTPTGKVLITGSLSAAFQNALNLGERLSIELERLRPETQKLDVQAGVPYLFGTQFGVDGRLGIFKRDSTWVDAQSDVGVQYMFTGGDFLRFLWENKSASLQKLDTATIVRNRQLPANLDLKQNGFGLESAFTRLDYRFNPRKGWNIQLKAVAGFNKVQRNNQIESLQDPEDPNFQFSSLYDSITERSTRFRLEGQGAFYVPMFVRTTLKIGLRAGGIFSNKAIFANEQYRLGGNKLLRGFDEESLQATRFVVATAEYRLLIGQNAFLGVFTDWGYIENLTDRNRLFLRPFGIGAGLNFETRAGIFGINVAVGRNDPGQAVNFKAAKFHLGYVSLF
jgi:outer membrane protein assembly factor BamA